MKKVFSLVIMVCITTFLFANSVDNVFENPYQVQTELNGISPSQMVVANEITAMYFYDCNTFELSCLNSLIEMNGVSGCEVILTHKERFKRAKFATKMPMTDLFIYSFLRKSILQNQITIGLQSERLFLKVPFIMNQRHMKKHLRYCYQGRVYTT